MSFKNLLTVSVDFTVKYWLNASALKSKIETTDSGKK